MMKLTNAVEILYTGGPNSSKRHAVNPDPSIRRTLCGKPVKTIGAETMIQANITCVACRRILQSTGVLVDFPEITIPANAADTLGEKMTIAAPVAWHARIEALAPRCCYGPQFNRAVLYHLADVDAHVRNGYSTVAYDHLVAAEAAAAR